MASRYWSAGRSSNGSLLVLDHSTDPSTSGRRPCAVRSSPRRWCRPGTRPSGTAPPRPSSSGRRAGRAAGSSSACNAPLWPPVAPRRGPAACNSPSLQPKVCIFGHGFSHSGIQRNLTPGPAIEEFPVTRYVSHRRAW